MSLTTRFTDWGRQGERTHTTREDVGTVSIEDVRYLLGKNGEYPGAHRNRHGQAWEDFKDDIAANGIQWPIHITIDWGGEPEISEGNHRRDAAVELGFTEVPVQVTYFGRAEEQGIFGEGRPLGLAAELWKKNAAYGYDDDFWPEDAEYPEVEYRIGNDVAILYRGIDLDPGWSLSIPDPDGRTDWTWAELAYDDDFYVPHVLNALEGHVGRHWSFSRDAAESFVGSSGVILTARVSGAYEEVFRDPKEQAGVLYREDDEQEVFLRENALVDLLGVSIRDGAEGERSYWLDLELPQRMEIWASAVKPLRGYHITLKEYLPSILSQGLQPRSQSGVSNYDSWLTSKDDRVYLAESAYLADSMQLGQMAVSALAEKWLGEILPDGKKEAGFEWMELTELTPTQLEGLSIVTPEVDIPSTYWDSLDYDEDLETFGTEGTWAFVGAVPSEWITVVSDEVPPDVEMALDFLREHGGRSYREVYEDPITASRYASDSQEEFESKVVEVAGRLGGDVHIPGVGWLQNGEVIRRGVTPIRMPMVDELARDGQFLDGMPIELVEMEANSCYDNVVDWLQGGGWEAPGWKNPQGWTGWAYSSRGPVGWVPHAWIVVDVPGGGWGERMIVETTVGRGRYFGVESGYWLLNGDYEPATISDDPDARLASSGFDGRLGRCYELAAKEVCYGRGGTLVHGTITNNLGNGRTIDHAWVERDNGMIFDAVLDDEYTPETYEYFYGPNPMFRYTQEEVLVNIVETENWGPWEDEFYEDGRDDEF